MELKPVEHSRPPAYPTRREVLAGAASFAFVSLMRGVVSTRKTLPKKYLSHRSLSMGRDGAPQAAWSLFRQYSFLRKNRYRSRTRSWLSTGFSLCTAPWSRS